MNLLKLLSCDGFLTLNKYLIKEIGLHESIILSVFASKQNYYGDWFYCTYDELEDMSTLSKYQSSKAIENLIQKGILSDKKQGVPCRRYFLINDDALANLINYSSEKTSLQEVNNQKSKNFTHSSEKTSLLAVEKLHDIKNRKNTYKEYNNKNTYKKLNKKEIDFVDIENVDKPEFLSETNWIQFKKWWHMRLKNHKKLKSTHAALNKQLDIIKQLDNTSIAQALKTTISGDANAVCYQNIIIAKQTNTTKSTYDILKNCNSQSFDSEVF